MKSFALNYTAISKLKSKKVFLLFELLIVRNKRIISIDFELQIDQENGTKFLNFM